MQLRKTHSRRLVCSLTPLIDVVFILLVFFLLSSSFTQWNTLSLSVSTNSEQTSAHNLETSKVRLKESGSLLLDGKDVLLPTLLQALQNRIHRNPQHLVLVETARLLPLQDFVIHLKQLQQIAGPNLVLVKQPLRSGSL